MRSIFRGFLAVGTLALLSLPNLASAVRPSPCPSVLSPGVCPADPGASMAQCCPCDDFRNHGRYVRCVAHATNALRRIEGCLDRDARRSLKRCAARSTCSKPGGDFVTCCRSMPGICDEDSGLCLRTEEPISCLSSEECPVRSKCTIKRGAQRCIDHGGVPGTGSCCGACQVLADPNGP